MNKLILNAVALRYRALYLGINREDINMTSEVSAPVIAFVARLKENGFSVSEELLHALCAVSANDLSDITDTINDIMGVSLNWAPLVKGWNVPTGESHIDHLVTLFANLLGGEKAGIKGEKLACGCFIPEGTFPLERYNGCPFCGKPFKTTNYVFKGQGSKLKELRLFTDKEMKNVFESLLSSATPLDGTQKDSLQKLLTIYPIPENIQIGMKETAMLVVKSLIDRGKAIEAGALMTTPTDILRYLWFEKTGNVQIIEPKTLVAHARKLYFHMWGPLDRGVEASAEMKKKLQLKYNRQMCRIVAEWLNGVKLSAEHAAENMNPKRSMWVRMIRALRLGEYARKPGFERLAKLLDVFYHQNYTTWQGQVDEARINNEADAVIGMLKQRPGMFARCLFATMLRFGKDKTLAAFDEVADKLPARLLLSLGNAADFYFDIKQTRIARPITGGTKEIPANKLLNLYSEDYRKEMAAAVNELYKASMKRRYAAVKTASKTIYIDPMLYHIPVSVGDRATTIQDTSCALMGTRFAVEGDAVRLFLQWGKGLHAQHLDMDLSCRIALGDGKVDECAYYHLKAVGAKHSGDIRSIPEMVGTAEYIELSIPELIQAGASYVTFTCNAYSWGELSPNLVVGWMDSTHPMKISEKDGVAYDPLCVQHMVRINESNLAKGLVFGILDIAKREIVWLEMPFTYQTLKGCNSTAVEALLQRLENKLSVGELLSLKASAQGLASVESTDEADESYTYEWALNPAAVANLLLG